MGSRVTPEIISVLQKYGVEEKSDFNVLFLIHVGAL